MKLRQRPEDFLVREVLDVPFDPSGAFGLYRLEKRGRPTPAVIAEVARAFRLSLSQVGVGGFKDSHADTAQHITLPGASRGRREGQGWRLEPLGRVREALRPGRTGGNRFQIAIRDLSREQAEAALARVEAVARDGVPNYFDSQRFGALAGGKGFAARALVAGRFEEGLRTLLTSSYRGLRRGDKDWRQDLDAGWGDWKRLAEALPQGEPRRVAAYLRDHPGAWSGALRCLDDGTRWLALAAYQSHLFNQMVGAHLKRRLPGGVEVPARAAALYFPLKGTLDAAPWPLPRRGVLPPESIREDVEAVLKAEGVAMEDLRVAGARLTFPKGERAPWVIPTGLAAPSWGEDELNAGRYVVTVAFALPPGAYGTVVIKRLTYDAGHTFRT